MSRPRCFMSGCDGRDTHLCGVCDGWFCKAHRDHGPRGDGPHTGYDHKIAAMGTETAEQILLNALRITGEASRKLGADLNPLFVVEEWAKEQRAEARQEGQDEAFLAGVVASRWSHKTDDQLLAEWKKSNPKEGE